MFMTPATGRTPLWTRLGIVFAIWTGLALALTAQAYLVILSLIQAHADLPKDRPPLAFTELLLSSCAECVIWAILTLGLLELVRRYPFGQGKSWRSLAVHVTACLACGLVAACLSMLAAELIRSEIPKPTLSLNVLVFYFVAKLNNNIFFYWAIVAVAHVLNYYRQLRARELLSSQLEAKLAQTQLQVLKMQLQPHFLFNTLNAIAGLVREKRNDAAVSMIVGLSDFLRRVVEDSDRQQVPLGEELEFTQKYLDIQKVRFAERLQFSIDVPQDLLPAQVPSLILQPMVENAVKHGIARRVQGGAIRITAFRSNGTLTMRIYNDGPSLPAGWESGQSGIGIVNVRTRLQGLYGDQFELRMRDQQPGGVEATVSVPFVSLPAGKTEE
jgi:two-component system, LytTR family, sensor kinase